jgi:2-keto-4-pentenoate hydratase/2-oxohepta-3-ene-1,7-dioic acid hydratase in catechol pathway
MRLVRFNEGLWGLLEGEIVWETEGPAGRRTGRRFELASIQLRAPAEPSKIVCVGRNYLDHIREMGHTFGEDLPKEPGLFLKGPNTLADPGTSIPYPPFTRELHYEGELALVLARPLRQASPEEALSAVLGYTCALDLTARDAQRSDLQWVRAKSADRFCPLGPWLETELDPQATVVRTWINGEKRQEAPTSWMIFPVAQILSYTSSFMTLEPGDVILTGTPQGVGPLQPGDRVEVEVEGVGRLQVHIA